MKFDVEKIVFEIKEKCPEVIFAFLHGSSKNGTINEGSNIDVAIYLNQKSDLDLYSKIIPGTQADIGILNNGDPVFRFEALKGKMLFCRDKEKYAGFFSLTCRGYEDQITDYECQQEYRKLNNLKTLFDL